ncbi:MAG: GvpL/GvpF family gas vesicle protein [Acidobacteria bacterium]|nr:GvpL/GvpF family gas vesicle protein [Acidobacteriota bacterium]
MPEAFYIYCLGEEGELSPLFDEKLIEAIEPGTKLQLIAADALAAVASVVPLADYGEEGFQARLAEPAWVAARAMRHERVLEHFASRASVIPLRFGAIYLKRARVEEMLHERAAELRSFIKRLRGKEEWGVNLFCDRAQLLEQIASLSPALREINERAAKASAGQAYLLRKKVDAQRADEARAEVRRVAGELERKLSAESDGVVRLRLRQAETAEHGDLAAKLAFLVEREGFKDFRAAAEELAAHYASAGFRLELTGPWPAYNFVAESEVR